MGLQNSLIHMLSISGLQTVVFLFHATEEFIVLPRCFIDDLVYQLNKLELQQPAFTRHPEAGAYHSWTDIKESLLSL